MANSNSGDKTAEKHSQENGKENLDSTKNLNCDQNIRECAICMEEMKAHNILSLSCSHVYHEQCIRTWLRDKSTCPICRHKIRDSRAEIYWDMEEETWWDDENTVLQFIEEENWRDYDIFLQSMEEENWRDDNTFSIDQEAWYF